jgi:hypothetical protein
MFAFLFAHDDGHRATVVVCSVSNGLHHGTIERSDLGVSAILLPSKVLAMTTHKAM